MNIARITVCFAAALAAALAVAAFMPQDRAPGASPADDAARILRYLSDDARGGRASFTEGNREAARFIAAEFESAGLRPLDSTGGFLRPFSVRRTIPESLSVMLDGKPVPAGDCLIATDAGSGSWALSDSFTVRPMGATFDRGFLRKGSGVVLVPRAHEEMFRRYQQFMSRARVSDSEPSPGAVVAVLTDSTSASSASVTYRAKVDQPTLENVVAVVPGNRPKEFVLFSGHYDHLGILKAVDGDSIANGADDDGSGTTAMLLLARRFAGGERPERTLVFAAFAAEEIGGFGARHLAKEIPPDQIMAMVNLEMLGTESKFGPKTFWITGYDSSDLGPIVAARLKGSGFTVYPDPYPDQNLFFRSDNATFARAGVPAHTFSTTRIDVDSVYHTVNDEFSRIDTGHLAEMAGAIAQGVSEVVSGQKTPTRVKIR